MEFLKNIFGSGNAKGETLANKLAKTEEQTDIAATNLRETAQSIVGTPQRIHDRRDQIEFAERALGANPAEGNSSLADEVGLPRSLAEVDEAIKKERIREDA